MQEVTALDAAMPFDFEAKAQARMVKAKQMTIGIVGFGNFGQFLAERLVQAGHKVLATSRTDHSAAADALGVSFSRDPDDFCESHPDVVILATSITSMEAVLRSLPLQRLRRSTLFVDVLSVKEFPRRLMLHVLPPQFDVLCTHPMFGPDSGKGSWAGLNFMFEKVRIGSSERCQQRLQALLQFFEGQGCNMKEMTCGKHDALASRTQFVTHTIGRVLGAMELEATDIDTRGYESLQHLVDNTAHDSFELYYGLFMYNQNATEELARLEQCFDLVKKQLFDRMHNTVRQQLFHPEQKSIPADQPAALPAPTSPSPGKPPQPQQLPMAVSTHSNVSSNGNGTGPQHAQHLLADSAGRKAHSNKGSP